MAASLWLQLPSPPPPLHSPLFLSSSFPSSSSASPLPLQYKKHAPARGNLICSSSSPSVVTKQEGDSPAKALPASAAPVSYKDDPNFRGCKGCGREETERGCNGEGRIMGGIAAVPLFGWWPIKAYRPCPGFVASGGRYRRYGQSMDDVIAGKGRKLAPSNKKNKSEK
ncbi:uncharacterized protein LOC100836439 [Brachypodium distachyon]|uniref:Uncharacterized protein n=1 Tax=Brachypodium distachyon TaxID=15368 RepID=I1HDN0_BRADI|nr:uncharacterized protein LOC100836439 [Brachypodium distachyon]KQK03466.1 hypothetical protein BRADI_2g08030v3 [Brachypodium distachyon]|eukprot:XP_003566123.1 uncharacterized protein LOC100836439 [Brachypodium distachyon]